MKANPDCLTCNGTGAVLRDFDGIPDDDYCPDCMVDVMSEDVKPLRDYLLSVAHTDYGLSDEQLEAFAQRAREYVGGRRWSWKIVAHNMIREREPFHAL